MKQISSVKRIDQYKRIYVPDNILEAMSLDVDDHIVWMHDEHTGEYSIRKATITIE